MQIYRCAHCGELLGAVSAEAPQCPNHPDGIVEVVEDGNQEPV